MKIKTAVYDIETLSNLITFCFLDFNSKSKKSFILFDDIKQFHELVKFLNRIKNNDYWLVGFNCNNFDAQIIEKVLELGDIIHTNDFSIEGIINILYQKAQEIIQSRDEDRFKILIPEYKFSIKHIDLFLQKHYNRPQKFTSLKWLEFTMRRHRVKDMPIHHDSIIVKEQIEEILDYNWEDVEATAEAFERFMFETDLRLSLSDTYKKNLMNAAEPKLAREIFGKYLCEEMKISYKELKDMRTNRNIIHLKDIIFPYIKFENPIFKNLLSTLLKISLKPEQKLEYTIDVYGLNATFALGGLHSNNNPTIFQADENHIIITSDVKSYYPNLAIENDLKPAHLGNTFSKIYKMIYEERGKYDKKDPMNYVFKIVLNSAYGLSSEQNSYLYDVSFTRAICINGELLLLLLCEMVKKKIPDAQFLMLNTDGLELKIPKEFNDIYFEVCKEWEELTKLVLEHSEYKKIILLDINNYLAIDNKDYIKKKGRFETEMDYHKNPSFLVVSKAVEAYFIKGQDYKTFIQNHEDIFDFLGAVKKKSNFDLNLYSLKTNILPENFEEFLKEKGWIKYFTYWIKQEWIDERKPYDRMAVDLNYLKNIYSTSIIDKEHCQKVTRFYVAKNGRKFYKDFNDGRRVGILTDWYVETAQEITNENVEQIRNNLDLNFYIKEVEKIIEEITPNRNQLAFNF